jgi:hypothetical protein
MWIQHSTQNELICMRPKRVANLEFVLDCMGGKRVANRTFALVCTRKNRNKLRIFTWFAYERSTLKIQSLYYRFAYATNLCKLYFYIRFAYEANLLHILYPHEICIWAKLVANIISTSGLHARQICWKPNTFPRFTIYLHCTASRRIRAGSGVCTYMQISSLHACKTGKFMQTWNLRHDLL